MKVRYGNDVVILDERITVSGENLIALADVALGEHSDGQWPGYYMVARRISELTESVQALRNLVDQETLDATAEQKRGDAYYRKMLEARQAARELACLVDGVTRSAWIASYPWLAEHP